MNIIDVQQGSQAWLELRRTHDTASEAPTALGASKYTTRATLMRQKATGAVEDVAAAKQSVFDRGHAAEAMARPLAEAILGNDLYPVTATLTVDGLKLLASLDGATMLEDIIWEHKLFSEALAADVRAGTLAPHYTIQMDQQLLVSGAKKCLFMTSDGTEQNMAWCWYESSQEKFDTLIAGWQQFNKDLAAYVPTEVVVPAVAAPQMGLPAVAIQVTGSIALVDNLDKFGAALTAYIERINKEPETDQDFADLEATVKTLKAAEEALDAAENGALAQTASIDSMRRTVGLYRDTARTNRLLVEKLVKVEKENRRTKIVTDGIKAFAAHIDSLNARLGKHYMPAIAADFHGVVKGLKGVDSMRDKVAGELARAKIEANAVADRIQINLATLRELAKDHSFLFADTSNIVLKANDDLTALVKSRIADHQAEVQRKEEATRERIRQEEQERADRLARENLAAEQAAAAAAELASAKASEGTELSPAAQALNESEGAERFANVHLAVTHDAVVQVMMPAAVRQAMAPVAKPQTPPTMALGAISEKLGFTVTSAFLATLGFEATTVKAAKLFHEEDFPAICRALIEHIESVCEMQAA